MSKTPSAEVSCLEAGAVGVDLVEVVVVADVLAHGEHDALAVEVNVRIAKQALRARVGHDARLRRCGRSRWS